MGFRKTEYPSPLTKFSGFNSLAKAPGLDPGEILRLRRKGTTYIKHLLYRAFLLL